MCGNDLSERRGGFHGFAHNFGILYAPAVIRKSAERSGAHIRHIRKMLAAFADRYCAVRNNGTDGIFSDCRELNIQVFGTVGNGIKVRHRTNGGITACRCGIGAAFDCLFVFKARFAKVNMNVT